MPDWTPNWSDVRFDHAAAEAAAAACDRAARVLADSAAANDGAVRSATAHTQGARVERLARRFAGLQAQARTVEAHLHHAAAQLRAASERARADQATRVAERERWRAEADVERLLDVAAHHGYTVPG